MNGYFQVVFNEKGIFLHLIPETEEGEKINLNEVLEYLKQRDLAYDARLIGNAAESHQDAVIPLYAEKVYSEQEGFVLKVSADQMVGVIRFYPPVGNGGLMDKAEIMKDLAYRRICYGIQEQNLDSFIKKREYCRDFVIALGKKPVQGHDAKIDYFFNTDIHIRPTQLEDGSVDFFNLNTINHCQAGDILARLYPEQPGEDGFNIYGEKVVAAPVKKKALNYGLHIACNQEKTLLTSEVNGHVVLVEDRVFVSDTFEVENVDNSTGNIEYEGNVLIRGNVCANFSVRAKGDIEVAGVVEGAYLEAEGNIIISRGMKGMEHGCLKAGGNVITKFLENTMVTAGGYVETESILHCKVAAGTEVIVTGKKAFITGGTVSAAQKITAKTFGSAMAAVTVVEVGVNPAVRTEYQQLQKEVVDIQKTVRQIEPVIAATAQKLKQGMKISQEQMQQIQNLVRTNQEKKERLTAAIKEMDRLHEALEADSDASVEVNGIAYPGTRIIISDASLTLKDNYKYCRFKKISGDVKSEML